MYYVDASSKAKVSPCKPKIKSKSFPL